jgi:hypothetical protein
MSSSRGTETLDKFFQIYQARLQGKSAYRMEVRRILIDQLFSFGLRMKAMFLTWDRNKKSSSTRFRPNPL